MEIFDANVLIQLVVAKKQNYNVSRAKIGVLVQKCVFQSANTKRKLEACTERCTETNFYGF